MIKPGMRVEVRVAHIGGACWIPGVIADVLPRERTGDVERFVVLPDCRTVLLAGCRAESLRLEQRA